MLFLSFSNHQNIMKRVHHPRAPAMALFLASTGVSVVRVGIRLHKYSMDTKISPHLPTPNTELQKIGTLDTLPLFGRLLVLHPQRLCFSSVSITQTTRRRWLSYTPQLPPEQPPVESGCNAFATVLSLLLPLKHLPKKASTSP